MSQIVNQAAQALMNAGGGRARIHALNEVSKRLDDALKKVRAELVEAIKGSSLGDAEKEETLALVDLGNSKLWSLAQDWAKQAEHAKKLEQPTIEQAAQAYLAALSAPGPVVRLRRAWQAAIRELKSP